MAFNFDGVKNVFKRKKKDDFRGTDFDSVSSDPNEEIKLDSMNPFEEGSKGDISFAEKDTRQGRKLKSKYVIAGATLIALLGIGAVASNLLAPDKPLPTQEQKLKVNSAADDNGLAGSGIPSNYEELAKFEQNEKLKQEEAAKKQKEKEEEERRKRMKEERARQEKEARANERNRTVQTPRVNINRPVVSGPVGPSQAEQKAYSSSIGFNVPGGSAGGSVASYLTGSSSNVDMGTSYSIHAGTIIPATLLSGVTSDGTTDVVAQVRQDVYDSQTGEHLLIPQGSKLLGVVSQATNRRIGVSFKRIILPDGTSVKLPEQRAVDKSGYAGMKDKYDSHDSTFFRSALISGVMSYLADEVDSKAGRKNGIDDDGNSFKSALNDTVEDITDRIMDRSDRDANRSPSIMIRPGFQFNVFINEDLVAFEYIR